MRSWVCASVTVALAAGCSPLEALSEPLQSLGIELGGTAKPSVDSLALAERAQQQAEQAARNAETQDTKDGDEARETRPPVTPEEREDPREQEDSPPRTELQEPMISNETRSRPGVADKRPSCRETSDPSQCVIDRYRGRARHAYQIIALADAYVAKGRFSAAVPLIQQLLERYPTHARADRYRTLLKRHGIEPSR